MSDKYTQKAWSATDEALLELKEISEAIGVENSSATIRYCIRKVYQLIKKGESI